MEDLRFTDSFREMLEGDDRRGHRFLWSCHSPQENPLVSNIQDKGILSEDDRKNRLLFADLDTDLGDLIAIRNILD